MSFKAEGSRSITFEMILDQVEKCLILNFIANIICNHCTYMLVPSVYINVELYEEYA